MRRAVIASQSSRTVFKRLRKVMDPEVRAIRAELHGDVGLLEHLTHPPLRPELDFLCPDQHRLVIHLPGICLEG